MYGARAWYGDGAAIVSAAYIELWLPNAWEAGAALHQVVAYVKNRPVAIVAPVDSVKDVTLSDLVQEERASLELRRRMREGLVLALDRWGGDEQRCALDEERPQDLAEPVAHSGVDPWNIDGS